MRYIIIFILFLLNQSSLPAQINFGEKLSKAAVELTNDKVKYDPAYYKIAYPNGDVPAGHGVCSDVVIRAYRKLGIDLQKELHEDIRANFTKYPAKWGMTMPDPNIDHRRVPNLMCFLKDMEKNCLFHQILNIIFPRILYVVTWEQILLI